MTAKLVDANRILDNARTNLPGALDTAICLELFNVLNDFFNRTNIWWEDITFSVDTSMGMNSTVCIQPSEGGVINRLLGVYAGTVDNRRRMTMPQLGELMFVDVPSQAETWTARCALTVSDPVPEQGALAGFPQLPDFVVTKYYRGITAGLVSSMMTQVGKPYSNPKMAAFNGQKYSATVAEARGDVRRQNLFGAQAWRFPAFAS